jgi:hypothetical protein
MIPIVIESALFAVLVAAAGALCFAGLMHFTPIGVRWRQVRNRRMLEREAARHCPVHGLQREGDLVRLRDGQILCPTCYQEILDGKLD